MKSDGAYIDVAHKFKMKDKEGSYARDDDKIGSTKISRLTWSRNKFAINEFKSYQELIGKFYEIGNHFIMISNNTMRFDDIKKKHYDKIPSKSITMDLNTTSISAVHVLFQLS